MTAASTPARGFSSRWLLLHVALPVVLVVAAYVLRDVLAPIIAALFLAYALSPVVDRLERWRIPRSVGAALALVVVVGTLVGLLIGLLPAILAEFQRFVEKLPEMLNRFASETVPRLEKLLGVDLPDDLGAAAAQAAEKIKGRAPEAAGPIAQFLGRALTGALSFLSALLTVLLVPILTYFFLRDFPRIVAGVRQQIPNRYRESVESYVREVDDIMSSYLRGQLLMVVAEAILFALALWVIGLRLGVAIGILAGLLSFVPYAGFVVGLALALLMALMTFEPGWMYLAVLAVFGLVQVLEQFLLTPLLVGRRVGLATVWVLVAIIVFGATFGFVGVLLAVPLGAIFRTSFKRLLSYRAELDRQDAPPPAAGTPAAAPAAAATPATPAPAAGEPLATTPGGTEGPAA